MPMKNEREDGTRQAVRISNDQTGVVKRLLLPEDGRLSVRQVRETRLELDIPGKNGLGLLREHPLKQYPFPGRESFEVVRAGRKERGKSDVYFIPTSRVADLLKRLG